MNLFPTLIKPRQIYSVKIGLYNNVEGLVLKFTLHLYVCMRMSQR